MSADMDGRFAPPQAQVQDIELTDTPLAGRWIRLLAALIDVGVAVGMLLLLERLRALASPSFDLALGRSDTDLTGLQFESVIVDILIFLVVQAWPLVKCGQTIGKMLCRLRIVRTNGTPADAWRLLGLRYGIGLALNIQSGAAMIYSLIDCLLIFRTSRQCLHDTFADTKVIKL